MVFLGPKWNDPGLSLGERCVAFAENEMKNNVGEDKLNSFTSPRLREYFAICTRLVNGKETSMKSFTAGNWCAAGVSFCLHESLLSGEVPPHGYRLGVVEVVADMQHNKSYHTIDEVRNNTYTIKVGDIIIFDRSTAGKPETQWYRHIGRVYSVDSPTNFKCISGNNGGKWRISSHTMSQASLLGFGAYPAKKDIILPNVSTRPSSPFDTADIKDLAPSEDSGSYITPKFFDKFFGLFGSKS
jgi:hypothetical protein